MSTTDEPWINKARRKVADKMARMALWMARDMRRRLHRPRTFRLPKMARMLKAVVAEAQAAGVVPPEPAPPQERRHSRPRRSGQISSRFRMDRESMG